MNTNKAYLLSTIILLNLFFVTIANSAEEFQFNQNSKNKEAGEHLKKIFLSSPRSIVVIGELKVALDKSLVDQTKKVFGFETYDKPFTNITYETAIRIHEAPILAESNGSMLFHGGRSASLLIFNENLGKDCGRLIPMVEMLKKGMVPFSGELCAGAALCSDGYNVSHLSTCGPLRIMEAVRYASTYSSNKKEIEEYLQNSIINDGIVTCSVSGIAQLRAAYGRSPEYDKIIDDYHLLIKKMRIDQWRKMSVEQRELVTSDFPVLYGLRPKDPAEKDRVKSVWSSAGDELLLKNGASSEEIRSIFVPREKIKLVEDLKMSCSNTSHIVVLPIEELSIFNGDDFWGRRWGAYLVNPEYETTWKDGEGVEHRLTKTVIRDKKNFSEESFASELPSKLALAVVASLSASLIIFLAGPH